MNEPQIISSLLSLPTETEWVEFKRNNDAPDEVGEYISAISNSAALHDKEAGYILWVMTNTTLRERFNIAEEDYPLASRIIRDTVKAGLIKLADPDSKSRKHAKYVPFWA